jgi:hypothetical protein
LNPPRATKDEPPARASRKVTIPEGTVIPVVLAERVSTEVQKQGDTFSAHLSEPLVVDGLVIAEKNAAVLGRVVSSEQGGKVRGSAELAIELTQITTSDGQKIALRTSPFSKKAESSRKEDAVKVGAGAAIGAAIGAIAGGGRGAAIGAGAGAGAGTGAVVLTRGKPAELASETRLSFRLSEPVSVTERVK